METTPKNGDESESASAKPAESTRPKKSRPPVEIDLPAESVSEVKAEPAPAPAEEPRMAETPPEQTASEQPLPPPPPPAKPSMAMPLALALVAGVAGSLGVQALLGGSDTKLAGALDQRLARLEQAKPPAPAIPSELNDRLAKAEKALAEVAPREQALQAEITRLSAAVKTLSERPVATAPAGTAPAPEVTAEIERLRAAAEAATKQAEGQVSRISGLNEQVTTLAKAVASANGELARASASAVVSQNLADSFQRNEALGGPIEALKALGVAADRLAPLAAYAQTPPPSLTNLGNELRDLAKASTEVGNGAQADFLTRLRQGAPRWWKCVAPARSPARMMPPILRAPSRLWVVAISRRRSRSLVASPAPRAERFAGWKAKAEARAKAGDAIRQIRQESLAGLARAAAPAKP